jgi:hypothetical protein
MNVIVGEWIEKAERTVRVFDRQKLGLTNQAM